MTGNNNSPWDPNNQQGQNPGYGQNQQPDYQNSHYPQGAPGYGGQPPAGYEPYPYGQPKRSNKTPIIIAVIVVALIAIGALVFFLLNGDDDNDADNGSNPTTAEENTPTEDPFTDPETEDPFTDPETEDPFTDPETEDPFTDPETEDPDVQYGDPNADPARFRSGMEDILAESGLTQETAEEQGITPEQWDTYLGCVTDESLQRLTPEVIESISGGQDVYDSYSVNELSDIAMQCGEEAGTL